MIENDPKLSELTALVNGIRDSVRRRHPNEAVITALYSALQRRDGAAMGACYHPNARFRDEVFTLEGFRVRAMSRMLCLLACSRRICAKSSTVRILPPCGRRG